VFPDLSAVENVMTGTYLATRAGIASGTVLTGSALAEERATRVDALALLERLGFARAECDLPAHRLPFALQRKMEVARVLAGRPRLLLLDEPTAGLGPEEARAFMHLLTELRGAGDLTILLVEHNVRLVFGVCECVTAMHEGATIVSGPPEVVRRDPVVVASYLGGETAAAAPVAVEAAAAAPRAVALAVRDLSAGYGAVVVLRELSFEVRAREVVAVFGRNGAGKSTLLGALLGNPRPRAGSIRWREEAIAGYDTHRIVRSGIGLVPQEGGILAGQSVDDNLLLGTFGQRLPKAERERRRDEMFARFPRLAERRRSFGGNLSGGERRMLAIAKVLMRRPALLLLDEPSIGLAPTVVEELQEVVAGLRSSDLSILITEQNVRWVLPIADRAYLIDTGTIVREGAPNELAAEEALLEQYLGT
jgi:ABC-type branched-subunit amino acid transport system ATPase component